MKFCPGGQEGGDKRAALHVTCCKWHSPFHVNACHANTRHYTPGPIHMLPPAACTGRPTVGRRCLLSHPLRPCTCKGLQRAAELIPPFPLPPPHPHPIHSRTRAHPHAHAHSPCRPGTPPYLWYVVHGNGDRHDGPKVRQRRKGNLRQGEHAHARLGGPQLGRAPTLRSIAPARPLCVWVGVEWRGVAWGPSCCTGVHCHSGGGGGGGGGLEVRRSLGAASAAAFGPSKHDPGVGRGALACCAGQGPSLPRPSPNTHTYAPPEPNTQSVSHSLTSTQPHPPPPPPAPSRITLAASPQSPLAGCAASW